MTVHKAWSQDQAFAIPDFSILLFRSILTYIIYVFPFNSKVSLWNIAEALLTGDQEPCVLKKY